MANQELLAALTLYAGLGYEISFSQFGYDQYEIKMKSREGVESRSVLPEDHLEGNFIEVLIHLFERIKKQKQITNG